MARETRQEWALDVMKKMLDLNLTQAAVARQLGVNYQQLSCVLSGTVVYPKRKEQIIEYVNGLHAAMTNMGHGSGTG